MSSWKIWKSILWQTWRKTFDDLHIITGWGLMAPFLLYAIYAVLIFTLVDVDTAKSELISKLLLVAAPLALFPVYFLFSIPLVVAKRETSLGERLVRLKTRLTPRFRVDAQILNFDLPPTIKMAVTGPHNVIGETADYLCLLVTNIADRRSDITDASITELVGDNGSMLIDPVELRWVDPEGHDATWASLATKATRTARIFHIVNGRPAFNMAVRTKKYSSFFENGSKFTGKIALEDRYYGGQLIHFVLTLEPELSFEIIQSVPYRVEHEVDVEDEKP